VQLITYHFEVGIEFVQSIFGLHCKHAFALHCADTTALCTNSTQYVGEARAKYNPKVRPHQLVRPLHACVSDIARR